MPRFVLVFGRTLIKSYDLPGPVVTIGRDPEQDVVVDNPSVSRQHARIVQQPDGHRWVVEDLGTPNGTFLNGKPIESAGLEAGDEIGIGKHALLYEASPRQIEKLEKSGRQAHASFGAGGGTMFLRRDDLQDMRARLAQERLAHVVQVDRSGQEGPKIVVDGDSLVLGKGAPVPLRGWFVARRHALIYRDEHGFRIRRLGGMRALFVNGSKVDDRRLANKDVIRVGANFLRFYDSIR